MHNSHTYNVIVDCASPSPCTAVQLGDVFDAAGVVSSFTGAITFSKAHNLQTNDRVVYNCEGGTGIGGVSALGLAGLTCGGTYYVYRLNDFTLRLGTSQFSLDSAGQLTSRYDFAPSSISSNTIHVSDTTASWPTARRSCTTPRRSARSTRSTPM